MQEISVPRQEYMILPFSYYDGQWHVICRRLPKGEYLEHYSGRKGEIHVDDDGVHWLWLRVCSSETDAQGELRNIAGRN